MIINIIIIIITIIILIIIVTPMPVTARCKAWGCGHSLARITGSDPAGARDVFLLRVL
jgi:hypothetical protein